MTPINYNLTDIALDRVSTSSFEQFCNAFFGALIGQAFVPLGGHHDGGADGFQEGPIFEVGSTSVFYQFSKTPQHRKKIRETYKRIIEFGRKPKQIVYCTSNIIHAPDAEEDLLGLELDVMIRIRDKKYIISHINNSDATVAAHNTYLSPYLDFLREMGGTSYISHSPDLPVRSLSVFLGQEVERRRGNTELLEAVTDSLILWSLDETDPDKGIFLTRDEMRKRILSALPAAKQFIHSKLNERLSALSSKSNTAGREINWYRKQDHFCLPHSTRVIIQQENSEDEILRTSVSDCFRTRAAAIFSSEEVTGLIEKTVKLCHRTLELTFEKQGLELVYFLSQKDPEDRPASIADNVDQALEEFSAGPDETTALKEAVLSILRQTFYHSDEVERKYLTKLSRTYTLLFVLKNEPRVVEYFRKMSKDLVLYVGSDLFIRALSEFSLPDEDRMTWNMLKILRGAGATLVLNQPCLEEIISHIRATDLEFKNHYKNIERFLTKEIARHCSRILIRAYMYALLEKDRAPKNWAAFISMFCTYDDLHTAEGEESLKRYLCEEFGCEFEDIDRTMTALNQAEMESLAAKLVDIRKKTRSRSREDLLAKNDAIQVLRIFQKRREIKEGVTSTPYGYRTWWLTQEISILKATNGEGFKALYMMRPEFVLNFISLAPSAADLRRSYETIFPSLLGVRLSNRLRPEVYADVLAKVEDAGKISDARARALVSELSDKLKGDQFRTYEVSFKAGNT